MKVLLVACCLAVMWSEAIRRTPECSCGYGNICMDDGGKPEDGNCSSSAEQCRQISGIFYNQTDCHTPINHCYLKPCSRGHCVPTFGSYFCVCPDGWYGQKCTISDPHLASEGVKNPLYIYYQVQTGRKGQRIPFHLIYDPGPQLRIMKRHETGVKVYITFEDGRVYYPIRREQFKQLNVKQICLRDAKADPDLFDIRVCDYVPEGERNGKWACPYCRVQLDVTAEGLRYTCFCERTMQPRNALNVTPHGCGQGCKRGCGATCHPGPCAGPVPKAAGLTTTHQSSLPV